MRDLPLELLVAAALAEDQAAWSELVRRYSGLVWAAVRSYRLSAEDGEDVVQLTWLLFAQHLGSLRNPHAVGGWLTTAARREALRSAQRARRGRTDSDDELADRPDPEAPAPDERLLRAEQAEVVRRALETLSPQCQELLGLLFGAPESSYRQVAERTGMAAGSVGPIRARCLERLRRACGF